MAFESFAGNARIVERLRAKLAEGRFPHALIFSGPEGIGKRTCARMVAKALNCIQAGPHDFCDACSHCRKINSGAHPDVTLITVEEDASEIKIGQIREVLRILGLQPLEAANKIFIVDPANLMKPPAASALLKGLEEPPENSFFILIAPNAHELLITVRSRCQIYHFSPLTLDEIRQSGVTDELSVRWSQGSIGKARSLNPAAIHEQRETALDFLETAAGATESEFQDLIGRSAGLSRAKQDFPDHLAALRILMADLLYLSVGTAGQIVNIDIRPRLEKLAATLPVDRLIAAADHLQFIESTLKSYFNRQMLTDVLALTANATAEKILNDKSR